MSTPLLQSLAISGTLKAYLGQTQQLTLTAYYSNGSSAVVTSQASWSVSNTLSASITQAGLVTAISSGTVVVTAALNGVSTQTAFVIPALLTTTITPPVSSTPGQVVPFTVVQSYSDGSVVDLTTQVSWFSTNPSIGTIGTNTGLFTCIAPGIVQVGEFQTGQLLQSVSYTVLENELVSLTISSPASSVISGMTLQLTVTGTYTDGSTANLTSSVTWNAANPTATISTSGLVTGQSVGLSVLTATYDGIQGNITLDVYPAPNANLVPQFRSHLTQVMQNYFDHVDSRPRKEKYALDAQLLNVPAQSLEVSQTRFARELNSTSLAYCPANIDNKGVYYQQVLPSSFDFTTTHVVQGMIDSSLVTLNPYDDIAPVPAWIEENTLLESTALINPSILSLSGIGITQPGEVGWATQYVNNPVLPIAGRINFWLSGTGFNQVSVTVRITGQRNPQSAWANKQQVTSETLTMNQLGFMSSKFSWAVITQIQVSGLAVGLALSGQVGTYGLAMIPDFSRPYTDPTARGTTYNRYWTYADGLLQEQYLASTFQGFQYIQSYACAPISAIAIEPNTYGMFLAQGTTLLYVDRREPLPSNLNAPALTTEPYYGVSIEIDQDQPGPLRYIVISPVPYAQAASASQYRYLIQTPQGITYALTPDGVYATYTQSAGWRRGAPVTLTIPLAQTGTYVITLQCLGPGNSMLQDSMPYPNLALSPLGSYDLSSIVSNIQGLSFDERGRLWVWDGENITALAIHYGAYLLDSPTQAIYLTDVVTGLVIDGVTI
jgi:hypothetical protein